MKPQKPIQPFSREAYQDREYNERNGYTRRDYEEHAAGSVLGLENF